MNNGELKSAVASWMHRSDMTENIPGFIDLARERINRRFTCNYPVLVNETDTNESLEQHGDMWLHAALAVGFAHVQNGPASTYHDQRYYDAANAVNVTGYGTKRLQIQRTN